VYPRDAAQARYCYGLVSVSHKSVFRCSIETSGRTELVIGMEASFDLSHTVLSGNLDIHKNNGTSDLWKFVLNDGLRKFRYGTSTAHSVIAGQRCAIRSQNWTCVGELR